MLSCTGCISHNVVSAAHRHEHFRPVTKSETSSLYIGRVLDASCYQLNGGPTSLFYNEKGHTERHSTSIPETQEEICVQLN